MQPNDTILVTGAAGLLGSTIVDVLKQEGFQHVIAATRASCDLLDKQAVMDYFAEIKPDYVFHCAARVYGVGGSMNYKALTFYENCLINTHVIHATHQCGARKITAIGSGSVYPYPSPGLPLKEEMIFNGRPHHAQDAYALAKRAMLAMLEAYHESYGLEWAYVVSCNLFGPKDKFDLANGKVVPSLIKKFFDAKQKHEAVKVWGDGSARRDFMYVTDAAHIAIKIMDRGNEAINIGSGQISAIRDIVSILSDLSGVNAIEWDKTKPNGQDYRAYDLSKIQSLGFRPAYSTRQGLQLTWDWYCRQFQSHPTP